jgi:hypothetical protein
MTNPSLSEAVERAEKSLENAMVFGTNWIVGITTDDLRIILQSLSVDEEARARILEAEEAVVSCGCCDEELIKLRAVLDTMGMANG